ncbi:MAG: hypothetical protein ACYDCK_13970, partial [Thermoplasmatota archaeon]
PGESRRALEAGTRDIVGTTRAVAVSFVSEREVSMVPVAVTADKSKLGPKYRERAGKIAAALATMDPNEVAHARKAGKLVVKLAEGEVALEADEYAVTERPNVRGVAFEQVHVGPVTLLLRAA